MKVIFKKRGYFWCFFSTVIARDGVPKQSASGGFPASPGVSYLWNTLIEREHIYGKIYY